MNNTGATMDGKRFSFLGLANHATVDVADLVAPAFPT